MERSLAQQSLDEMAAGLKAIADLAYQSLFSNDGPLARLTFYNEDLKHLKIKDMHGYYICILSYHKSLLMKSIIIKRFSQALRVLGLDILMIDKVKRISIPIIDILWYSL